MKLLLIFLLTLASLSSAFSEVPKYWARHSTCEELKEGLENYGGIIVKTKVLVFTSNTFVEKNARCGFGEIRTKAVFKTKNKKKCLVGTTCMAEFPRHEDPCSRNLCGPFPEL